MLDRRESVRLQLRVLYRQFLVRVIDFEALSVQADVIKLLGQFAAILAMISIIQGGTALLANVDRMPDVARVAACWTMEHRLIATTMLVVGLFANYQAARVHSSWPKLRRRVQRLVSVSLL